MKKSALFVGTALLVLPVAGQAATITSANVFATAPGGATKPDSISIGGGSVFVSYAGGTNSQTGTGTSTIVQYSLSGATQATYSIGGSVDGLKYNPVSGQVFALQNQDGNSTLSLINPSSHVVSGPLSYAAPPYVYGANSGRGYDDVAFANGNVFLSYTNPASASDPVIQKLNNGNTPSGTLTTTDVLTAGQSGVASPDTDSLKTKPNGDLILTAGSNGAFTTVHNAGTASQTATATTITYNGQTGGNSIDDILFPSATAGTLYVSDQNNNRVVALNLTGLDTNSAFVSFDGLNAVGLVDPSGNATTFYSTGVLGPLASPHGLEFVAAAQTAVPEPASLALLGGGLLGLLGLRRRTA